MAASIICGWRENVMNFTVKCNCQFSNDSTIVEHATVVINASGYNSHSFYHGGKARELDRPAGDRRMKTRKYIVITVE